MNSTANESNVVTSRTPARSIIVFLRDLAVILIIAFVVSYLVKTFFVRSFYIPSSSMTQTLQVNDRILVNQLKPNLGGVERGDVIVFRDPGGWLTAGPEYSPNPGEWLLQELGFLPSASDDFVIKRVIGVGGDRVQCCNGSGQMSVNGVPLEEPYVFLPPGESSVSAIDFDVVVPEGSFWVMGDNRYGSKDSRYNTDKPGGGFVSDANVVGVAFVINWPIQRWAWLGNYPETFAGVENVTSSQ